MVPDRQKVRTDGRRQNYIPPTSSRDKNDAGEGRRVVNSILLCVAYNLLEIHANIRARSQL